MPLLACDALDVTACDILSSMALAERMAILRLCRWYRLISVIGLLIVSTTMAVTSSGMYSFG